MKIVVSFEQPLPGAMFCGISTDDGVQSGGAEFDSPGEMRELARILTIYARIWEKAMMGASFD